MASKAVEMMGSVPLFSGLSSKEVEALCVTCKETEFPEAVEIFKEGSTGVGFHLILEGEVEVVKQGSVQATLSAGSFFGEMSLIDGGPRSATIRTRTPLKTLSLTSWEFRPLIERNPSIAVKLLEELSRRLRASESSPTH